MKPIAFLVALAFAAVLLISATVAPLLPPRCELYISTDGSGVIVNWVCPVPASDCPTGKTCQLHTTGGPWPEQAFAASCVCCKVNLTECASNQKCLASVAGAPGSHPFVTCVDGCDAGTTCPSPPPPYGNNANQVEAGCKCQ
jgi:hypothetical protein